MPPEPISVKPKAKPRPPRGEAKPSAKAPPAGPSDAARDATPEPKRRSPADRKLSENLSKFYGLLGVGMAGIGNATGNVGLVASGVNVASKAEDAAEAWMAMADNSPAVRKALEGFATGSTFAGVIGIHVAMLAPAVVTLRDDTPQGVQALVYEACLSDEAKAAAQMFGAAQAAQNGNGVSPN
jgi:hypothetical protein